MPGARRGTRSQVSRITPRAEGGTKLLGHRGCPTLRFFLKILFIYSFGIPGWRSGSAPALAQGVILETQDRIPRQAPGMEPASPSACVSASLSLYVYHE